MDYFTYSERLNYLIGLAKKGKLASPKIIADQFNCTEKTIRNMINCLRKKGYRLEYNKNKRKYIFRADGKVVSV
jgi:biotin operon repressor